MTLYSHRPSSRSEHDLRLVPRQVSERCHKKNVQSERNCLALRLLVFSWLRKIPKWIQDIMWNYLNKTDRKLMAGALIILLMMLYLLYNDDLLLRRQDSSQLKKIGQITELKDDVRQKISSQFTWKSLRSTKEIHLGDSLFTGANSSAVVKLDDGRTLTLQENSLIAFNLSENQLDLALRAGTVQGTLKGCVKFRDASGTQDLCGENSKFKVLKNGSLKLAEKVPDLESDAKNTKIQWLLTPGTPFHHFRNSIAMKVSWKSELAFTRYHFQFSRKQDFKKISFEETTSESSLETKSYPSSGLYFIRVKGEMITAENISKPVFGFSTAFKIEVQEAQKPRILAPLASQRFNYKSDADGELLQANSTEVRWTSAHSGEKFKLEIKKEDDLNGPAIQSATVSSEKMTWQADDLPPGQYLVRVRDTSIAEEVGDGWSEAVHFEIAVISPPRLAAPVLLTKKIQYDAPSTRPLVIEWSQVPGADHYSLETSSSKNFEEFNQFSSKLHSFQWTEIKRGRKYFRVRAQTRKDTSSEPSEVGVLAIRFQRPDLNPVPSKVLLGKSPEDPGEPTEFSVSWTEFKGIVSYEVQIAEEAEFRSPQTIETRSPSSVIQVPKPGDFYYRVRGMQNGVPATVFSKPGKLTYYLKVPLSTPTLLKPYDQMTLFFQQTSKPYIWLEWKPVRQAANYQIELASDANFTKMLVTADSKDSRFLIREQLPDSFLFWRIRAIGEGERVSNWSQTRTISILSGRGPASRRPMDSPLMQQPDPQRSH